MYSFSDVLFIAQHVSYAEANSVKVKHEERKGTNFVLIELTLLYFCYYSGMVFLVT